MATRTVIFVRKGWARGNDLTVTIHLVPPSRNFHHPVPGISYARRNCRVR